ncbi:MAG: methyl-accepting chemotaxis protein [Rhodocyclaceae bacterium]|nr:methyl-accepting chemotaxis protein [Rhodocyclaceae bacterium]
MTLRQRLFLVLAILVAVTLIANGFSFLMYLRLAEEAGRLDPKLLAQATQARQWMLLVIGLSSLIGLAAFVQLARLLLALLGGEPQYAADVVKRISNGELGVPIELAPHDRTSLLAAIAAMRDSLREMAGELSSAATQLHKTASQFQRITGAMESGMAEQSAAAQQAVEAVERLSAGVSDIAAQTAEVDRLAEESLARTQEGNVSLSSMIGELSQAETSIREMTETAREFVNSATAITQMTREVRDIADQTNLLALNAAIEAARAGEQGRGFAVVADEVRKLAEKSAKTASDIDRVTKNLQEQAARVEAVLDRGLAALGSSQEYLETVAVTLGETNQTVTQTTEGMARINAAVASQTQANAEISRNVDRIVELASRCDATVGEVIAVAKALETLAGTLEAAVRRFRL